MANLVAMAQKYLGEIPIWSVDGLRKLLDFVHELTPMSSSSDRRTLFHGLLKEFGATGYAHNFESEVHTPKGKFLVISVANPGLGKQTTGYNSITVDVDRRIVFTSPGGLLVALEELTVYPDFVAGERQPILDTGEEYWEFFSHGPRALAFYIGDLCNAKCVMCWQAFRREVQGKDHWHNEMKAEVVEAIVAKYALTLEGVELISFGEPMVNPEFDQMVDAIIAAGKRKERIRPLLLNITTNGSLVHCHRTILETPGYLTFSIDAASKELYERIRVGLKWKRIYENFKLACQYPTRHLGRRVGISMTVFEDNADQIVRVAKMCSELGAAYLSVLCGANLDGSNAKGREIDTKDSRLVGGIDEAKGLFPKLIINDYATGRVPLFVPAVVQKDRGFCPLPWRQFDIGVDGYTHPCCRSHYTNLGHVLEDDIWNGEPYTTLRQQILDGHVDPVRFGDCANCPNLGVK